MRERYPNVSVVVPIYNESAIFQELYRRLSFTLRSLKSHYQMIFVDDGSSDNTLELIKNAAKDDSTVKYLSFSRNFGHQVAVSAGLEHADQDVVVVMDGDLQDPPELIPDLLKKWMEGYQVVYAIRRKRKEGPIKKLCYHLYYRLLNRISDIPMPVDAGDFCLMDKKVNDILKRLPEKNRYVRGIRAWAGFRQTPFPYERDRRYAGKPKYSFAKLFHLALNGITSFSQFPLKLSGYLGYLMAICSFLGIVYTIVSKILFDQTPRGWTSLALAFFFIGGVQLIMLSIVGIYIGKIYTEVQNRPLYILRETNLYTHS